MFLKNLNTLTLKHLNTVLGRQVGFRGEVVQDLDLSFGEQHLDVEDQFHPVLGPPEALDVAIPRAFGLVRR